MQEEENGDLQQFQVLLQSHLERSAIGIRGGIEILDWAHQEIHRFRKFSSSSASSGQKRRKIGVIMVIEPLLNLLLGQQICPQSRCPVVLLLGHPNLSCMFFDPKSTRKRAKVAVVRLGQSSPPGLAFGVEFGVAPNSKNPKTLYST